MKKYAVSDLVKEVKVILDRNQESTALLSAESDTLSQGELIRSRLVSAARMIESNAPIYMIDSYTALSPTVQWTEANGAYVGSAQLPSDMLRIVSVKASGWVRNADIITPEDEEYRMQQSKYGVRGSLYRPVAAVVPKSGGRCLELYTSQNGRASVDVEYVKAPAIADESIELPEQLKDAVLYMAAYLVGISLGDTQSAEGCRATACRLAGIVEPSQS